MLKTILTTSIATTICLSALASNLSGKVEIDGSSTVFPVSQAVAEAFEDTNSEVKVEVGVSGTGGGFKRFAKSEIDISDASRPIKTKEIKSCEESGVEYIELPVAYDGLSIVVNNENTWLKQITVEQLNTIFNADYQGKIKTWKDVDPSFPAEKLKIFSPGSQSGTFDYFKEVVLGKKGAMRSDISTSEDDNDLIRGVEGAKGGISYFGYAYYSENADKIKVVPVVNPKLDKAITPTPETIEEGQYAPFSRPLFIYVNKASASRPQVKAFVEYYLKNGAELAEEVGYTSLPAEIYKRAAKNFANGKTGTQFTDENGDKIEGPLTEVYK